VYRNKLILLLLIGVLFLQTSCKDKSKIYKPTTTIIEGQITSSDSPVISLIGTEEVKAALDPSGKFIIQVELEKAGIYSIHLSDQYIQLFIIPGDRITLIADQRTLSTSPLFKGDHAKENNYLVLYENLKKTTEPQDFQLFFTQPEDEFIKAVEERTASLNASQQEYQKKNGPFDEFFAEMISEEVAFDAAVMKMNYPIYFEYLLPDSNIILSDTYDSFLQNLEIDSEDNLMIPSYKKFITMYMEFKTKSDTSDLKVTKNINKFNNVSKLFQSEQVKNLLYYTLMLEMVETSVNDAANLMEQYKLLQTNVKYKEEIQTRYNSWSNLVKGKPSPDFIGVTTTGKTVSLQNMKDKLIYMDIWATWCGPCLREIPYLEKLQEKYVDRDDIIFLSISIDDDKNAWTTMIKQKDMKGLQLYADTQMHSKMVNDFLINGIPRFIIIDKTAKIWNVTAPRPSSEEVIQEIDQALAN
jgi:thiol-disulfide isomerase/thioredoxin